MKEYFDKIINLTQSEYYQKVEQYLQKKEKKMIITANPEIITYAQGDAMLKEMYMNPSVDVVADGVGLIKAAKFMNVDISERIPGVELAEYLLQIGNEWAKKVLFYGSKEEVIQKLQLVVADKYPKLIPKYFNGYGTEEKNVAEYIKKEKPDIIIVALGMPRQEKFIYESLEKSKKGIFVGVGGSLDVISGFKKRAPKLIRKMNLEWLYRILREPSRIKRFYNNNYKFYNQAKKEAKKGGKDK